MELLVKGKVKHLSASLVIEKERERECNCLVKKQIFISDIRGQDRSLSVFINYRETS